MDPIRRRSTLASLAVVALTLQAQSAQAQGINRCRIDGRLVLQSAPCALDAPMRAVATVAVPSPEPAAANGAPKKKTLADLLRERDGAPNAAPPVREAQGDGAHILRARMGAV